MVIGLNYGTLNWFRYDSLMKLGMKIIAACRIIDGKGNLDEANSIIAKATQKGFRFKEFKIASMWEPWAAPLAEGTLRCATSTIEAMIHARSFMSSGSSAIVVISGVDNIKSESKNRKEERSRLFRIYGETGPSLLEAYNSLGHAFIQRYGVSASDFRTLSEKLFNNYLRTWVAKDPNHKAPDGKWFNALTDLFRGVDCANPSIDFSGCIVLATDQDADSLEVEESSGIEVLGAALERSGNDGPEHISEIVEYSHLTRAYEAAVRESGINFPFLYASNSALLETYTCYPVVPLAFLLKTGLVDNLKSVPSFLEKYPITISGGLNLAKAPGNNTTLNAIIEMVQCLRSATGPTIGGIHSNGALGYSQAFCILASNRYLNEKFQK
jgi:hypothetical protein